jgi:methionyl-tRNA formyltransferase
MRILFAGTPVTAVPTLEALLASDHELVGVLTRADAPTGRGRTLRPSPVKALAQEAGLPVLTPASLRPAEVQQQIADLGADLAVVVAFGKIIPASALAIPTHGWINLHFSLLPQWRGAAPAQRAVLAGQTRTGISVFRIEEGLDTGPVLAEQGTDIGQFETAGDLLDRLAEEGAPLLLEAVDRIAAGTAQFIPQDEDGVSTAAKLSTEEARIDWSLPAAHVGAHIRGMSPDPGAWTRFRGERMKVLGIEAVRGGNPEQDAAAARLGPGALLATRRQLLVGTADGPLALSTLAPAGKKVMRAADWARGADLGTDERFEQDDQGGTEQA